MFELLVRAGLCSAFSAPNITEAESVLAAVGNDGKKSPSDCSHLGCLLPQAEQLLVCCSALLHPVPTASAAGRILARPFAGAACGADGSFSHREAINSFVSLSLCFLGQPCPANTSGKNTLQLGDNNQLTVPFVITKRKKRKIRNTIIYVRSEFQDVILEENWGQRVVKQHLTESEDW